MLDRTIVDTLATADDIAALRLSHAAMSDDAIALLGFQRTKQVSPKSRKAWEAGDPGPLRQEASDRRDEIFAGAVLEAYREYLPLRDYLAAHGIAPKTVIDIGCGQAIPDLFLQRDFKPRFTLVDIEETPEQYHFWAESGAGYASLADAQALLLGNGAARTKVNTINPVNEPEAMEGLGADMLISFYSCGFHYPVDDYADLMVQTVANGGLVCLDLRRRYLRRRPEALDRVLTAGAMEVLYDDARSHRVVIRGQ
jgi:hypothetical protein